MRSLLAGPTTQYRRLAAERLEDRLTPTGYTSPYATTGLNPAYVADITARLQTAVADTTTPVADWYNPANHLDTWGPELKLQPGVAPPAGVAAGSNAATEFYMQRLVAAAEALVGVAYQHHHTPAWNPYDNGFQFADPHGANYWAWDEVSKNHNLDFPTPVFQNGDWQLLNPAPSEPNRYFADYHVGAAGIDCSDLTSLLYNVAAGIYLNTAVGQQGVADGGAAYSGTSPVGWNVAGTSVAVDRYDRNAPQNLTNLRSIEPQFVFGPYSTYNAADNTRSVTNFNAPAPRPGDTVTMDGVIARLQPGDLLYMAADADASSDVSHVVMWLGEYATDPDDPASAVPLVVSSHDNTPGVRDANGNVPPPGVAVLPFTPDTWFYQNFSHAMRVLPTLTAMTVTSSNPAAAAGDSVTFTATLGSDSGSPTGAVSFVVDGATVSRPLVNGVATYTTSALGAGSHHVTVTYQSDGTFAGETVSLTQSVAPAAVISTPNTRSEQPPRLSAAADMPSVPSMVNVYNPDGTVRFTLDPYPGFTGRVGVAVADLDGDGMAEVVTGAGPGGSPHVKVYDGRTGVLRESFFAYDSTFRGGVSVAAVDLDGDGAPEIVTGAGEGGAPHVNVFDGATGRLVRSFYAGDASFRGGVNVAVADVDRDGTPDLITGAGPGGGPAVGVYDLATGARKASFFAGPEGDRGGVRVAARTLGTDGAVAVVARVGNTTRAFDPLTGADLTDRFSAAELSGVFVG